MSITLRGNTQTLWTWLWAMCTWGAAAAPLHALASNSEQHILLRVTKAAKTLTASLSITQWRVCVCGGGRVDEGRRGMAQWWVNARGSRIARLAGCAFVWLVRRLNCWAWPNSWPRLLPTCLANRLERHAAKHVCWQPVSRLGRRGDDGPCARGDELPAHLRSRVRASRGLAHLLVLLVG